MKKNPSIRGQPCPNIIQALVEPFNHCNFKSPFSNLAKEKDGGKTKRVQEKKMNRSTQMCGIELKGIKVKIRGVKISFTLIWNLYHSNEFIGKLWAKLTILENLVNFYCGMANYDPQKPCK